MSGYGSIFGGCGTGVGTGLGALCGVEAMLSVYGERGREANDFEYDPDKPSDKEAL